MKPAEFKQSAYWFGGQLGLHILQLVIFQWWINDPSSDEWLWKFWLFVIPVFFIGVNVFCFWKQRQIKKQLSEHTAGARIWFSTIEIFSVGMVLLWIASLAFLTFMQYFVSDTFFK